MKTKNKSKKKNPIRFSKPYNPTKYLQMIEIEDSEHNPVGQIEKVRNWITKRYKYLAYDHANNLLKKGNTLQVVKHAYIKNSEFLLEQARQRKIASKERSKEITNDKSQEKERNVAKGRKTEVQKIRNGKNGKEILKEIDLDSIDKSAEMVAEHDAYKHQIWQKLYGKDGLSGRQKLLDEIRSNKDDNRGEMNLDR